MMKRTTSLQRRFRRDRARAYRLHGLSQTEFLTLTPADILDLDLELLKEREEENKVWDSRFANVMYIMYNMWRDKKSKKLDIDDFMPKKSKGEEVEKPPESSESLMSKVMSFLPPEDLE